MIDWRDSQKDIRSFTFRVGRRIAAAGGPSHLVEDVTQELWLAWCLARDNWCEDGEASFRTYLMNGMRLHINRWADVNLSRRHAELVALSLDAENGDEGDGATLHEVLMSEDPTPDFIITRASSFIYATDNMSPRTRQFVQLLAEQPEELVRELNCLRAKKKYAAAKGQTMPLANRITCSLVFQLMGADRSERTQILGEIERVSSKMERINA